MRNKCVAETVDGQEYDACGGPETELTLIVA